MLDSSDRMNLITGYISAYEAKIQLANKSGLLDSAKMFELFAIKVCELWFDQKFSNLNKKKATYPYLDLISDNRELFVQVSTTQHISQKIKSTLEKIKDSEDPNYSQITEVVFFVLKNNVKHLKEYIGDEQIGKIPFTIQNNLITAENIVERAENDLEFQEKLYAVIESEVDNVTKVSGSLESALGQSVSGLNTIDVQINHEYEIDRSDLIEEIKKADEKFISIQGNAGSGKTVLCKNYIQGEQLVLYARAERFLEESQIDHVWGCNIRETLKYLNGKKIIFFIDALEFIADCIKTKMEMLRYLYATVKNYPNAYIITSCRSCDKNAFVSLESDYAIKVYEVNDITNEELGPIMVQYPVIRKMNSMQKYTGLLRCPFYINLIVSKSIDIDDIQDENALRTYIWENIICLREKCGVYSFGWDDVVRTVDQIVFERAKNFQQGVPIDQLKAEIVQTLLSENILIKQENCVRVKYDIYEDICFEHYFDRKFDLCKGRYENFYRTIEEFGRCVYRRYQIWISNKIFIRGNREKFLYNLIFSNKIPEEWKKQTEIGIVKSRFCYAFFAEQGGKILEQGLLPEFVSITNLFAFECASLDMKLSLPQMQLAPVGEGRACLIRILADEKVYKKDIICKSDIVKLCLDYARQADNAEDVVEDACSMMRCIIDEVIADINRENFYRIVDEVAPYLEVLYRFAKQDDEWLREFFSLLIQKYTEGDRSARRMSEDVMIWTMKHNFELAKSYAAELCKIADALWMSSYERKAESPIFLGMERPSTCSQYGLSKTAEHYKTSFKNVLENHFLWSIFFQNPKVGLSWAIHFINEAVSEYAKNNSDHMISIELKIDGMTENRRYWGNEEMWLAGSDDSRIPTLLGDIVYILQTTMIIILDKCKEEKAIFTAWANFIKNTIYENANNIILLTVIENIGLHFKNELPGYALDLASNIDLICFDYSRYVLYTTNPEQELLKKQIFMAVGISKINTRYKLDSECNLSLTQYVCCAQIYFDKTLQDKCYMLLDYLYSITGNDEENAFRYLQIQRMDLRDAKEDKIFDGVVALKPKITGEAKKIVEEREQFDSEQSQLEEMLAQCLESMNSSDMSLSLILTGIESLIDFMQRDVVAPPYEQTLIQLIAVALKREELESRDRDRLCEIWINVIGKLFGNGSFLADIELTPVLLEQINQDASIEVKNKIKEIMLCCLMDRGGNGLIDKVGDYAEEYLLQHEILARAVFYTIIKLSEITEDDDCRREIIETYLFHETPIEMNDFDIKKYELSNICYIVSCGLGFKDEQFCVAIKILLQGLIEAWKRDERDYTFKEVIDVYQENEIVKLFQREMIQSQDDVTVAINILFNDTDFENFTRHTFEFYQNILGGFLPEFFDSYADSKKRENCKNKILSVESRVNEISNSNARKQLYRSLMLSVTYYTQGDWQKIFTEYSYEDKQFLNRQFTKYGEYYISELLRTIYQMHMDALLPEILISVRNSFQSAIENEKKFREDINSQKAIVDAMIVISFAEYKDVIQDDLDLTEAFEGILDILIGLGNEQAAVMLDVFRTC